MCGYAVKKRVFRKRLGTGHYLSPGGGGGSEDFGGGGHLIFRRTKGGGLVTESPKGWDH